MASGSGFYRDLDSKSDDLARSMRSVEGQVNSCNSQVAEQERIIQQAKGTLISARLDALAKGQLAPQLGVDKAALAHLSERMERLAKIEKNLASVKVAKGVRLTELSEAIAALERAQESLKGAQESLRDEMAKSPQWQELNDRWNWESQVATLAQSKSEKATELMSQKAAEYESDAMFMYLRRRSEKSLPITGFLDRWISNQIKFFEANKNYDLVRALPGRVQEHAKAMRQRADGALSQKSAFEAAFVGSIDLVPLQKELDRAMALRKKIKGQIDQDDKEIEAGQSAQREAQSGGDKNTQSAYALLFGELEKMSDQEAAKWAAQTQSTVDDEAMAQIKKARALRTELSTRLSGLREEYSKVKGQKMRLDELMSSFRSRDFDGSRSVISLNSDDFVMWYLMNNVSLNQAISQIDRHQEFEAPPPPVYTSSSSSSGSSGYGGFSSSSSSSDSGFSSSSSIDSGSFSTTDSF